MCLPHGGLGASWLALGSGGWAGRAGQVLAPDPDEDHGDDEGGQRDSRGGQEPSGDAGSEGAVADRRLGVRGGEGVAAGGCGLGADAVGDHGPGTAPSATSPIAPPATWPVLSKKRVAVSAIMSGSVPRGSSQFAVGKQRVFGDLECVAAQPGPGGTR